LSGGLSAATLSSTCTVAHTGHPLGWPRGHVAAEADWSYSGRMFESLYQSFEDRADPSQGAIRISALRAEFARLGLDGFLVPRADQHQNEYVAACGEGLALAFCFTRC